MAKDTLKNLNFVTPFQITDELYTAVGAGDNILGDIRRAFKGGVDFVIRTTAGGGGILLVESTDYDLIEKDQQYTDDAGFDIWTGYKITNAVYQACDLYFTYKIICSYTDVETINDLLLSAAAEAKKISVKIVANANYIILDDDGYTHILVSTGAIDRTITLPTVADNSDRKITVAKTDSGAGNVIVDGEGAEAINEVPTIKLSKKYNSVTASGNVTYWQIEAENISCQLRLDTYAGYGTTDNKIMKFANARDDFGNMFSHNHGAYGTDGLEITINKSGRYSFSFSSNSSVGSGTANGLSLNSAQLTISLASINVQDRMSIDFASAGGEYMSCSWSGWLNAGDIVRAHGQAIVPASSVIVHFTASYVGG